MIRIIRWAPVTDTEQIPPFGEELKEHITSIKGEAARHSTCSAWNLLYETLQENDLKTGTVSFTEEGKPFFTDSPVYFSLSHSRNMCCVSVSNRPTGIDTERSDRVIPEKVMQIVFSDEEYALYKDDALKGFCRKEAAAKLSGRGILKDCGKTTVINDSLYFMEETVTCQGELYQLTAVFEY